MKFTDAILIFVMLFSLYISILMEVRCCFRVDSRLYDERQTNMERTFINESFRNVCKGNEGFEDLNEWQSVCRAMFGLEYIGWGKASDFMQVNYDNSLDELICGLWDSGKEECQVFCRMEK